MADETKAPQIENPEKITVKDLAVMPSLPIYLFRRPIDPPGIATYAVPGGSSF